MSEPQIVGAMGYMKADGQYGELDNVKERRYLDRTQVSGRKGRSELDQDSRDCR